MTAYDERLDALLNAAAQVFADKGYHPTTMRDLARATGMSLAGMYYYVRSKEDLLALVLDRCLERVLAGATARVAAATDPADRLRGFIEHHVAFFTRHMPEMKVLSHEAGSLTGQRGRALRANQRAYAGLLEEIVTEVAPDLPPAERRVAVYALFGMMNWIYTWYRPDGPVGPAELAELVSHQALGGVQALAPAGGTR